MYEVKTPVPKFGKSVQHDFPSFPKELGLASPAAAFLFE